ncbi:MAG: amidase family protein [Paracoccaceae bacterium]|nr:amidase family protein [Paracoccaceae bacterium]
MQETSDWLTWTASDLGRAIGAGTIDPVALVNRFLKAIETHPDAARIYARTSKNRARSEAEAASIRARNGQRIGLLDGVPISWKDLFDTAGLATESGTRLLKNRIPARDAAVVRNAGAAGLVCLGKTHQSEFAFSGLGYNPITATPPCTFGADRVPGGSSSGAAASVAFGLAAAAIGSDTGGSVRVPAAWNDLVGLKTTHGRLSLKGVVPLCRSLDTVGPLTRSVEDAARMLAVLEGGHPADLAGGSLREMRFLVPDGVMLTDLEPEPARAFERSIRQLEAAGARITNSADVPEIEGCQDLASCLFAAEAYAEWKPVIEAAPETMYREILERFRSGASFSATEYIRGWQHVTRLRASWLSRTAGFDAVLAPTSAILPPRIEVLEKRSADYVRCNLLALRNTRAINLLGLCALTLPTSERSCGLMLVGRPMDEERLLRIGVAAESIVREMPVPAKSD